MVVIGICGPSCSGKSTIAQHVANALRAPHLSLDQYYIMGKKVYIDSDGQKKRTYERPESYDGNRLAADIKELQQSNSVTTQQVDFDRKRHVTKTFTASHHIVVEGFLLFTYKALRDVCTHRFFIDVPDEVIMQRRTARSRQNKKAEELFAQIGMQEWQQFGAPQQHEKNMNVLNGTQPIEESVKQIIDNVEES